jgi:predicted XRE-type DNA-binding protein
MLSRARPIVDVPLESVLARKSLLGAVNLCIELSGLDDKEIYIPLGIDAGHFSNLRKGKGHFPIDKLDELMDLCGNEVPLVWLAHKRGKGLVVLKSEAERRAEAAERRANEAEAKVKVLMEAISGRAHL